MKISQDNINRKTLIKLYSQILKIRLVEEQIALEYQKQEIRCPVHLYIGEEAIAAGVCVNLTQADVVMSNHRSHGHYLAKGGNLKGMIAEMYGKKSGCAGGRGGSQHLIDLQANFYGATPIVGGTIPVATGVAWSSLMQKINRITAVFFGDAATEEGVFHESLNFAVLKSLPILYICENNFYSILTPIKERQPKRKIYQIPQSYGMTTFHAEGNNAIEVYQTAKKAISYIRKNHRPAFVEFETYRIKEHCGPFTEPPGLRPIEEYHLWLQKDPLVLLKNYLIQKKLLTHQKLCKIEKIIDKEIKSAFISAQKSRFLREEPLPELAYAN